jgi:hypothetical protein
VNGLIKAALIGAASAVIGIALLGRAPGGTTVVGETVCTGDVDVIVTVNDCGAGDDSAVVLGRWSGACGPFSVDVSTVGPGIGYVCARQEEPPRSARWRGVDGVVLRLKRAVR